MSEYKLIEQHYIYDEDTDTFTFVTDHPTYKVEKNVFKTNGVDIDKITAILEYGKYRRLFRHQIMAVFYEIYSKKKPVTLRGKLAKAIMTDDYEGQEKYHNMLLQQDRLNLKVIK